MNRDYAISLIRAFATAMIVSCHICQYLGMELAWWLNVGVQIFLCISGFLYGAKPITNAFDFIFKQFRKILVDYWIVMIPVLFLYIQFGFLKHPSIGKLVDYLIASDTLPGGGHLWYIATALFCYAITPLLCAFFDRVDARRLIPSTLICMVVVQLVCMHFVPYFNPAWINCFILGFFLRRIESAEEGNVKLCRAVIVALALFLNGCQCFFDYVDPSARSLLPAFLDDRYNMLKNYAHVMLGVSLFVLARACLARHEFSSKGKALLGLSDKYSYDIYLVHQFFILSPFSLMGLTPFLTVNIFAIILSTLAAAKLVNACSAVITRGISWATRGNR